MNDMEAYEDFRKANRCHFCGRKPDVFKLGGNLGWQVGCPVCNEYVFSDTMDKACELWADLNEMRPLKTSWRDRAWAFFKSRGADDKNS